MSSSSSNNHLHHHRLNSSADLLCTRIAATWRSNMYRKSARSMSNSDIPWIKSIGVAGTISGPSRDDFHPELASQTIKHALNGINTDEKPIMRMLSMHTNFQRQKIRDAYSDMFERDMIKDIEEEIGGYLLDLSLALLCPPHIFAAHLIYDAILNRSANKLVIVEVLCTRQNSMIKIIKEAYRSEFDRQMDRDLELRMGGSAFGRMVFSLSTVVRNETDDDIDDVAVENDAKTLISAGLEQLTKNDQLFRHLFCAQSWEHIRLVIECYEQKTGNDMDRTIRRVFPIGKSRSTLLAIVKIAQNCAGYFADCLHSAIRGSSPIDDYTIIRIFATRSEVDLLQIRHEYQRNYTQSLRQEISRNCGGDYRRLLLEVMRGNDDDDDADDNDDETVANIDNQLIIVRRKSFADNNNRKSTDQSE